MIEKSSNVPRIIDRLEIKKWVKRSDSPEDRRETVIALTSSGITILHQATEKINKLMDELLTIETKDAKQLNELLERFRE
jgi:DNA-binding MarR family transcriptional regulator